MRGAEDSRADSRGGAFGVFRSVGLSQRTLSGAEGVSGTRAAACEVSAVRDADDGTQSFVCQHPRTNFIAAHLGFHGNDLERLGKLFDANPNMYVDIAAVLAELGRQPYSAHDFLVKYQDRVLMGKDIYEVNEYKWYFRALETRDEYFEYYRHRHAFWRIYGFQVPDEVLKKVYYKNALKLVPGIDAKAFPE